MSLASVRRIRPADQDCIPPVEWDIERPAVSPNLICGRCQQPLDWCIICLAADRFPLRCGAACTPHLHHGVLLSRAVLGEMLGQPIVVSYVLRGRSQSSGANRRQRMRRRRKAVAGRCTECQWTVDAELARPQRAGLCAAHWERKRIRRLGLAGAGRDAGR
jgi:hypothetical protein